MNRWLERAALAAGAAVVAAILAFYVLRLLAPLPIFAADAGSYLIRALYSDAVAARDPYVTAITNGTHLSLIRAAWAVGKATGTPYMLIDKTANAALYLGGLCGLWWLFVRRLPRVHQATLLLLAVGFAYHRFPFSNMAEGPFVGALALVAILTGLFYRRRPMIHAVTAGAASALMVLSKPHGIAVVAALALVALVDAAVAREWRRPAVRAALFAVAFFGVGNLLQLAAQEPVANPLTFFMSDFYSGALGVGTAKGAYGLAMQTLAISAFASLLLAGTPAILGLAEIDARRRAEGSGFRFLNRDVVLLMLIAGLAATLAMISIFAMKIAGTPSEVQRLWGRYFEFFVPMIWLAAAPALAVRPSRGLALACGAAALVGLAGLLSFLQRGWIVLPWDSAVLTAFFAADNPRAAIDVGLPARGLAAIASLLAAGALALRARPAAVGCALLLMLSAVSTWVDNVWLSEIARRRVLLAADLDAIGMALPAEPATVLLITPDANVGHLGFLELKAQPFVIIAEASQTPAGQLADAAAVVASGDKPPGGAWRRVYHGAELSLWKPAAGP